MTNHEATIRHMRIELDMWDDPDDTVVQEYFACHFSRLLDGGTKSQLLAYRQLMKDTRKLLDDIAT